MFPVLDVELDLENRRIDITFQAPEQAEVYDAHIKSRDPDEVAESKRTGSIVSLRLPGRITKVVASTKHDGFYLVFSDPTLAEWWIENLLIWEFVKGSKKKVYVDRHVKNETASRKLGMRPFKEFEPQNAMVSIAPRYVGMFNR